MQDWDTRIETLKANIENARKRWVLPYLEVEKEDKNSKDNNLEAEDKLAESAKEESSKTEEKVISNQKSESAASQADKTQDENQERKEAKELSLVNPRK